MKQIITILVIFAVHQELTEIILTTKVTSNEQAQLDSGRNRGVPPQFTFIREETSG